MVVSDMVMPAISVGAAVSLICFSPIDNENRVLSQEECGCYKMITAVLVIIFMLVDALLFVCQLHIYIQYVFQLVLCCLQGYSFPTFSKN